MTRKRNRATKLQEYLNQHGFDLANDRPDPDQIGYTVITHNGVQVSDTLLMVRDFYDHGNLKNLPEIVAELRRRLNGKSNWNIRPPK